MGKENFYKFSIVSMQRLICLATSALWNAKSLLYPRNFSQRPVFTGNKMFHEFNFPSLHLLRMEKRNLSTINRWKI